VKKHLGVAKVKYGDGNSSGGSHKTAAGAATTLRQEQQLVGFNSKQQQDS
jgi:hypothetical protein